MAVLWETAKASPQQVAYRNETLQHVVELVDQVQLWMEAEKARPAQITDV